MKSRLLLFLALSVHSATGGFKPSIDTRGGGPPRAPAPARTCDAGEAPLRLRGGAASCEPASLVERAKTWHPVLLALLGTSFGWFMTALGSAAVIINMLGLKEEQYRRVLDFMLGVSGGVMTAASYWSLLAPALEFAEDQGWGAHSYAPVALGFLSGGVLLQATDRLLHRLQARNSAQFFGAAIVAREPTLIAPPPPPSPSPAAGSSRGARPLQRRRRRQHHSNDAEQNSREPRTADGEPGEASAGGGRCDDSPGRDERAAIAAPPPADAAHHCHHAA